MMAASQRFCSMVCGLVLACASQMAAAHEGYSPADNDFIWQSRLAASRQAQETAYAKCHWKPERPSNFSDDTTAESESHQDQALYAELMNLLRLDQNARAAMIAWSNAFTRQKVGQVDAANLTKIKRIIKGGFPTVKMVGPEGANAMLMLVAHADADLDFQKQAFARLQEAAKNGGVPHFFPMVLAAIRPRITGNATSSDDHARHAHAVPSASASKPRNCYSGEYESSFDEHLNRALAAHFSAEVGNEKP